jgi:hypothetical protein
MDTIYPGDPDQFTDAQAPNHQISNYCYFLQPFNICLTPGDTSYKACSADEFTNPIPSVPIYTATVVDNKRVKLIWLKSNQDDFNAYLIFKGFNSHSGGKICCVIPKPFAR